MDRYQITDADVGAGFHAPTRPAAAGQDAPQIITPITWDGEAEEIEVEIDEPTRDYDGEIGELIERVESFTKLSTIVDKLVMKASAMQRELENIKEISTMIHSECTEADAWVKEEYPEEG